MSRRGCHEVNNYVAHAGEDLVSRIDGGKAENMNHSLTCWLEEVDGNRGKDNQQKDKEVMYYGGC